MNTTSQPLPEVLPEPSLRQTFGGIWTLTAGRFLSLRRGLFVVLMLIVLAALTFASVRDGHTREFSQWANGFYFSFIVPILAFLSGASVMRDDMKSETTDYVLIRPVRKPVLVVFRYISQLICIEIACLFALGVLCAAGLFRHIPSVILGLPIYVLAQFFTIAAFMALGAFFASLTSRYLIIGILYAGIIEAGIGRIPTQLNRISMIHHTQTILQQMPGSSVWSSVATLLGFTFVFLAAAAAVYSRRELIGTNAKGGDD